VARVIVDVMLKPEILDPQGRAVMGALGRLGMSDVSSVRQGKRFELEIDAEVDEDLSERLHEIAASLLSNPVIEDYEIYEEGDEVGCDCDDCAAEPDAATASGPVEVGRPATEQT
jgi:phosphoribosylformylglycinamidine synthase